MSKQTFRALKHLLDILTALCMLSNIEVKLLDCRDGLAQCLTQHQSVNNDGAVPEAYCCALCAFRPCDSDSFYPP